MKTNVLILFLNFYFLFDQTSWQSKNCQNEALKLKETLTAWQQKQKTNRGSLNPKHMPVALRKKISHIN